MTLDSSDLSLDPFDGASGEGASVDLEDSGILKDELRDVGGRLRAADDSPRFGTIQFWEDCAIALRTGMSDLESISMRHLFFPSIYDYPNQPLRRFSSLPPIRRSPTQFEKEQEGAKRKPKRSNFNERSNV